MKFFRTIVLTLLFLTSCLPAPTNSERGLSILASTTFLADITRNITSGRADATSLLPVGADPHGYQATPSDVAKISESTVLILNGVKYEQFIEPLLQNAGGKRLIIEASTGISPREDAGNEHGLDPHMWLDPNLVIKYVGNIRDGLIQVDPGGAQVYKSNADAYVNQLKELDAWIVEQTNLIPAENRLLVTNHEALGYFAQRYGFTVIGAVIPSMSADAAPSAQQMARLIDEIKSSGAPAIFLGEVENPNLAEQIANETGVKVVADLYLESLTDGAPAGTYIEMMRHNVTQIVNALR